MKKNKGIKKAGAAFATLGVMLMLAGCSTEIKSTPSEKIEATQTLETYPLNYLDQETAANSLVLENTMVISYMDKNNQEKVIYLKLDNDGGLKNSGIKYYEHVLIDPDKTAYVTLQKDENGDVKVDAYRQPYNRLNQAPLEGGVTDKETKK